MVKRIILLHIILPFIIVPLKGAQPVDDVVKTTYEYAVKDGGPLYLDKYDFPTLSGVCKPCIIFVFGGGFVTGSRDEEGYLPYFDFLVKNGYVVVSIDYRLGFRDLDLNGQQSEMSPELFLDAMGRTVTMAVDDLYDATGYVLANAGRWGIDSSRIILNGSSAGAVTVLQAQYELCNVAPHSAVLSRDFNYAGVISFAGAIFTDSPELRWKNIPAPVLLFHGDADDHVPYDKVTAYGAGFFGSENIARSLRADQFPYYFYSVGNAGHEIAGSPMTENREEIISFLRKYVDEGQQLMIESRVDVIGSPLVNKEFAIMDYIKANFAPLQ